MPSKLFCVATQHDLRKIMPRSSIKKFLRHFFQKVAYPNLCNFLKKWQNPISVTSLEKERYNKMLTIATHYVIIIIDKCLFKRGDIMAKPIEEISTAALTYLGDSIIELCVREMLVQKGVSSAKNLNSTALLFVKAEAQADAIKTVLPLLTEEENAAYRRGRNIGHTNTPKSATVGQYRMATGMEALFGYLYLKGRKDRINELFAIAYEEKINAIEV